MDDILETARAHQWWYSDTNVANLLIHEIERLREAMQSRGLLEAAQEIERLRELLREGLGEHVRLHVHPHFPAWEKRVREALGG